MRLTIGNTVRYRYKPHRLKLGSRAVCTAFAAVRPECLTVGKVIVLPGNGDRLVWLARGRPLRPDIRIGSANVFTLCPVRRAPSDRRPPGCRPPDCRPPESGRPPTFWADQFCARSAKNFNWRTAVSRITGLLHSRKGTIRVAGASQALLVSGPLSCRKST